MRAITTMNNVPLPARQDPPAASAPVSAWAPFSQPAFRIIWSASMTAALCAWMNDVAAAWLMTSMTTAPLMVALVQAASTLPMFLLGLPAGALADMSDRRRFLIGTQVWIAVVAVLSFVVLMAGLMNPPVLLILTFASGIGLALRFPGVAGALPETLPRTHLPQGLALNSVALNIARVAGPAGASFLIASQGNAAVYACNAAIALAGCIAVVRWQRAPDAPRATTTTRLVPAMIDGVRRTFALPVMRAVMLRTALFYSHATLLIALLPLVARELDPHSPSMFALLYGALGAGAVLVCLVIMPRLRNSLSPEKRVAAGTVVLATTMVVVAFSPWVVVSTLAMFIGGIAWTGTGNTLTTSAQFAVTNEIRSRGMSMYHGCMMGASAAGAAFWGWLAGHLGVQPTFAVAGISAILCAWLSYRPRAMRTN